MKYEHTQIQFKRKIQFILIILVSVFLVSACFSVKPIYYDEDKKIAEKQVERFHQLLNEEKYDEIYNLFSPKIQSSQSKEQFVTALKNILAINGKVTNSKLLKIDVKAEASFRLVHMFYETEFEKGKQLEEFDCLVNDGDTIFDFYGHPEQIPTENKEAK